MSFYKKVTGDVLPPSITANNVEITYDTDADEIEYEINNAVAGGVLTDGTPMAHVVLRAYNKTPNYLRTLPLHPSQREIGSTEHYADFSFDIRPTADFLGQLLSHGDGIEVLEPLELREKMRQIIAESLKRY